MPNGQKLTSLGSLPSTGAGAGLHVPTPAQSKQKQKLSAPPAPQRHLLYSFTPFKAMMECLLAEGAVQGGDLSSWSLTHSTWVISPPPHVALTPPPTLSSHQSSFSSVPYRSLPHLMAFVHAVPGARCARPHSSHILLLLILRPSITSHRDLPSGSCRTQVPLQDNDYI